MDEGLEGLDNPAKSASDPGGSLMWMRDCLGEWFRLKPLKRIITKTISKVLTNQTNNWPTDWSNQLIKPTINQSRQTDQVIENDNLARPATLAKAKTNQKAIDQTITITANIADSIGWGLELARVLNQRLEV